ncbi:MAG: hypothetical protein VX273_01300 [Acidobacteriota bacterium]|nr:hypothetical protein [Acidobacteriota bacterium]
MTNFIGRMTGAAKLNVEIYEEVEADTSATGQAMAVVCLSSLAMGIGYTGALGAPSVADILIMVLLALSSWFIWAFINYFIGARLFPEPQTRADHGELLRTMGFAQSPRLLLLIGIFPGFGVNETLGQVLAFAISVWMLSTMIVAVRQALDYKSTVRAGAVCFVGLMVSGILLNLCLGVLVGIGVLG